MQSLVWKMNPEAVGPVAKVNNDANLIARTRAGDDTAWSAIVERHWKQVWSLSRMIVRDPQGAEEVAQETFRTARDRLASFDADRSLYGWIQGICRQRSLDELRRRGRRPAVDAAPAPRDAGRPDLERALAGLAQEEREALLLSVSGYGPEELAAALGVETATARARTASARIRLLDQLDPGGVR